MKPKEYIKKHNLDGNVKFNHTEFIVDFSSDFVTVVELLNEKRNFNYARFKHCIKEIRQKWDGISNKMGQGGLPESLWKYFYATVVVKMRDSLFGEYLKQKEEVYQKRKREREEWNKSFYGSFGENNFFEFLFSKLYGSLGESYIDDNFKILEIEKTISRNEIMNSYRKLSIKCHPDKGGNKDEFIKLTEAKNKCLIYASQ